MVVKKQEKEQAIKLRKQGGTYSEIAKRVPVSKATLSVWLRDVPVPASYAMKVQALKMKAVEKGWEARRTERRTRTKRIVDNAQGEVAELMKEPLWLVGLTLYWAEGTKEKSWGPGTLITFTNMDCDTIVLFKKWCAQFLNVEPPDFVYNLYLHETHEKNTLAAQKWWASRLQIKPSEIRMYYKRTKLTHVRRNDAQEYHGVFRLQVKRSVDMTRRISGWTSGMINSLTIAR